MINRSLKTSLIYFYFIWWLELKSSFNSTLAAKYIASSHNFSTRIAAILFRNLLLNAPVYHTLRYFTCLTLRLFRVFRYSLRLRHGREPSSRWLVTIFHLSWLSGLRLIDFILHFVSIDDWLVVLNGHAESASIYIVVVRTGCIGLCLNFVPINLVYDCLIITTLLSIIWLREWRIQIRYFGSGVTCSRRLKS